MIGTLDAIDWYLSLSAVFGTPAAIVFVAHYMTEVGNWSPRIVVPAWCLAAAAWLVGLLASISL